MIPGELLFAFHSNLLLAVNWIVYIVLVKQYQKQIVSN